jgi:hypothetical protein
MGLFDALPMDGSTVPASALAEQLKVEQDLLSEMLAEHDAYFQQPNLISRSPDAYHYSWTIRRTCTARICTYAQLIDLYGSRISGSL